MEHTDANFLFAAMLQACGPATDALALTAICATCLGWGNGVRTAATQVHAEMAGPEREFIFNGLLFMKGVSEAGNRDRQLSWLLHRRDGSSGFA